MHQKLPRALDKAARSALNGEPIVAGAVVQADPSGPSIAALVTPTRFLSVDRQSTEAFALTEVGVADYQQQAPGRQGALGVLAGGELLRFSVPKGESPEDLHEVAVELRRHANATVTAVLDALPWWEAKAAWPYAARGRVAGGTTVLVPGQGGSLQLGRPGVSIYADNRAEPLLRLPWPDVTALYVEGSDELAHRITEAQVLALDLRSWALETTQGESFVTVGTRNQELYFAVQAPAPELRNHWSAVLAQYAVKPEEVWVERAESAPRAQASDLVGQLERLAALRAAGVLTEEEFAAAKAAVIKAG